LSVENVEKYGVLVDETTGKTRTMGPVDYLMVMFPGNKFSGKIVPELADLEKKGIIRVIDLVFVIKDANGKLFKTEARELKGDAGKAFEDLAKNVNEWFYEGDIDALASSLPNDSSAALLLFENIWAIRFKEALMDADAVLLDMGRIPQETIMKIKELMDTGGS
jgi:hypothetical protein